MPPRWHPAQCKECLKTRDQAGGISATGLCIDCADKRQRENVTQLRDHSGPYFKHWRQRIAASVGAILLDDAADEG